MGDNEDFTIINVSCCWSRPDTDLCPPLALNVDHPCAISVVNLDLMVTSKQLQELYEPFGRILDIQINGHNETPYHLPYGIIKFADYQSAAKARAGTHGRKWMGSQLRVDWLPLKDLGTDLRHKYNVFVCNLSPGVDADQLRQAFEPFGEVLNCRLSVKKSNGMPSGEAFITYGNQIDAQNAITGMNGQIVGRIGRIRTNWARNRQQ